MARQQAAWKLFFNPKNRQVTRPSPQFGILSEDGALSQNFGHSRQKGQAAKTWHGMVMGMMAEHGTLSGVNVYFIFMKSWNPR